MEENKYQRGKIYKIVSNVSNLVYYGSTIEHTLAMRLSKHRSNYKRYQEGKCSYTTSYKILEEGKYDIILVENFPCNNKDELTARERYYIENNDCVNKVIPGRIDKEYKKEYMKEYREQNKEKIKQKDKEKYENNKEKILQQRKEYYEANKELKLLQKKEYYEINKEQIKQKSKEKTICDCGCEVIKYKILRHQRTTKHIDLMKNKEAVASQ